MGNWEITWLPVLLQVLVGLLVFALGVPALLMQVVAPQALQRIVRDTVWLRPKDSRVMALLVWCVMLVTILPFITTLVYSKWAGQNWRDLLTLFVATGAWASVIAVFILAVNLVRHRCGQMFFEKAGFWGILRQVAEKAEGAIHRNGEDFQLAIVRLGNLGVIAHVKSERKEVLNRFEGLLRRARGSLPIAGWHLVNEVMRQILLALREMVTSEEKRCDADEIIFVLDLLRRERRGLPPQIKISGKLFAQLERAVVHQIVERILVDPSAAMLGALTEAIECMRDQPFELMNIGRLGVDRFPVHISVRALHELAIIYEEKGDGRIQAHLLGLAAGLRLRGPSGQRWVEERLIGSYFLGRELDCFLESAFDVLFEEGEFAAADDVMKWRMERRAKDEHVRSKTPTVFIAPRFSLIEMVNR